MKATFKVLCLLFCLTLTVHLNAATQLTFEYKYEYVRSFALKMDGLQNETHHIRIIDENGIVLFSEESENQEVFQRMYNLEKLSAGKYKVIVENEQKIIIQPIITNGRFLKIETSAQKEILKPAIDVEEAVILINALHFEEKPIVLTLKDKFNKVIYRKGFRVYGSLNKRLNLAQLPQTEYVFEIVTENYTVTKNINTSN